MNPCPGSLGHLSVLSRSSSVDLLHSGLNSHSAHHLKYVATTYGTPCRHLRYSSCHWFVLCALSLTPNIRRVDSYTHEKTTPTGSQCRLSTPTSCFEPAHLIIPRKNPLQTQKLNLSRSRDTTPLFRPLGSFSSQDRTTTRSTSGHCFPHGQLRLRHLRLRQGRVGS